MSSMVDTILLRKIMIDAGLTTITSLSKKSGISKNTLYSIFKGKKNPSTYIMVKLISALNISPECAGNIFFNNNLRNM